jgi:hypothetical protein
LDGDAYDFESYSPATSQFWDSNFKADLATESHVSYAHMPLVGERKNRWWQETLGGHFARLGNRGPRNGTPDPNSYTCDHKGNWSGNMAFADSSVEWLTVMQVPAVTPSDPSTTLDNLFASDEALAENDMLITFTRAITGAGAEYQHD